VVTKTDFGRISKTCVWLCEETNMERIAKMLVWKNVLNGKGIVAVHAPDTKSALWVLLREYEKTLDIDLEVFFNQIFDYEGNLNSQ